MPLLASPNQEVRAMAAGVLMNQSDDDSKTVQRACIRTGAAAALLRLLSASDSSMEALEHAAIALRQLCSRHAAHRRAVMAQPGSIGTLQRLLVQHAATPITVEQTLCALRHLAFDDHVAAIIPTVPAVLLCLRSWHANVVGQAASLLADLARYNTSAKQAIVSAGGVSALTAIMVSSPRPTAQTACAAVALGSLTAGNPQVAAASVHARGVGPGHPLEQAWIEAALQGSIADVQGVPPAEAAPRPGEPVPGLAPMLLPLQAAGYRWVAAESLGDLVIGEGQVAFYSLP